MSLAQYQRKQVNYTAALWKLGAVTFVACEDTSMDSFNGMSYFQLWNFQCILRRIKALHGEKVFTILLYD